MITLQKVASHYYTECTYAKFENLCSMLALDQHPYIEATKLPFEQLPSELARLHLLFGDLPDTELLDRAYTEFFT